MAEREATTVTLFVARYNELVDAELTLRALVHRGVQNWDGYVAAMENKVQIKDGPRQVFL